MSVKKPPARILPSACTAIDMDTIVRVRVERICQAGRGIEPRDAVARLSADVVKLPPTKILPSACTAIAIDNTVRVRVERIRQAGRGIEPGDTVARLSADAGENAAHQNLAVRLHRD